MKKTIRQAAAKEKMSRKATGGGRGPDEWQPKSEAFAELRDVISLSVDGLHSMHDDDDSDENAEQEAEVKEADVSDYPNPVISDDAYDEVEYLDESKQDAVDKSPVSEKATSSGRNMHCTAKSKEKWENYSPALLKKRSAAFLRPLQSGYGLPPK